MSANTGFLLVATGESYAREAMLAIGSLRQVMPDSNVCVFTNIPDVFPSNLGVETRQIDAPQFSYIDKIRFLGQSPFEATIFIDTDCWVCGDLSDLFEILEKFDIAIAHAPKRHARSCMEDGGLRYIPEGVPASFPQPNTGVIAFRNTPKVSALFADWLAEYERQMANYPRPGHDQPALQKVLYESDVRVATLAPEYNMRSPYPHMISDEVKIIHGRAEDYPALVHVLNKTSQQLRLYVPDVTGNDAAVLDWNNKIGFPASKVIPETEAASVKNVVKRESPISNADLIQHIDKKFARTVNKIVAAMPDNVIHALRIYNSDMLARQQAAASDESIIYIAEHMGQAHALTDRLELLSYAIDKIPELPTDALYLEFGVYKGQSINHVAPLLAPRCIHGFDSFHGIPEPWNEYPAGALTLEGKLPVVEDNVQLHVGLYDETLRPFLEAHGGPIAYCHIDCDLYSSTKTVLSQIEDRLVPGSILVFDEYINHIEWRNHEFKAFQEFVAETGLRYSYLAYNGRGRSVCIRVESIGGGPAKSVKNVSKLAIRSFLDRLAKYVEQPVFIQIGSNDGVTGDPLHPYIDAHNWRGVLVEPVPYLMDKLKQTYEGKEDRLSFVQAAICSENAPVTLYRLKKTEEALPEWYDQIASLDRGMLLTHQEKIPNLEQRIVEEAVPGMTLETLLIECNLGEFNLLHIDAEGFDWLILSQLDFHFFKPEIVLYEHKHLAPEHRQESRNHLEKHGYVCFHTQADTVAVLRESPVYYDYEE